MTTRLLVSAMASVAVVLVGCTARQDVLPTDHPGSEVPWDHAQGHGMSDGHGHYDQHMRDDGRPAGIDTPPIEGAPVTRIVATAMAFEPATLELAVGEERNLTLRSVDILHDLTIDEIGFHIVAEAGDEATGGVTFTRSGTYVAYCAVPGHRQAGMELVITVR